MSRVTTKHKHQDNHTNTSNNTYKVAQLSLTDEKNRSVLDTKIKEVKQEFRSLLVKRKDLITRLGKAFEAAILNPKDVCEEIKNCLHQEIVDKIISARDIERYCPDRWKQKTKPKNDNLSFSKQSEQKPQLQIAAMQGGKSVITNETSSITKASEDVNQIHDQSKQDGISVDNNYEAQTTVTNPIIEGELVSYNEPKDNTVSVGDSASSDVVQKLQPHQEYSQHDQKEIKQLKRQLYERTQELVDKISQNAKLSDDLRHFKELQTLQKDDASNNVVQKLARPSDKQIDSLEAQTILQRADEIPVIEFELPIAKENYGIVRDAMANSKASIVVKFDRNKNFLGADPDVVFDISGAKHQDGNVQQIQSDDVAKDEEQTESSEMDEKQKAENLAQIGYSNHALS
jgi:hypothetical protein